MDFAFYLQAVALGVGLSMDACAVSVSNGLKDPNVPHSRALLMAGAFGVFQGLMPLIGYFVGHIFIEYINMLIPWIALILLSYLGINMIVEGIKENKLAESGEPQEEVKLEKITLKLILAQAVATSIDALSVGVTIADYNVLEAVLTAAIVALTTFLISFVSVHLGKKFGEKLGNHAVILGGAVLVIIGLKIFISGIIG